MVISLPALPVFTPAACRRSSWMGITWTRSLRSWAAWRSCAAWAFPSTTSRPSLACWRGWPASTGWPWLGTAWRHWSWPVWAAWSTCAALTFGEGRGGGHSPRYHMSGSGGSRGYRAGAGGWIRKELS